MKLKDLEFVIPTYEPVCIVEYSKKNMSEFVSYDPKAWYSINGLNREVISICSSDFHLVIEVYDQSSVA